MESLERRGLQRGWLSRFYIRRAFRIYPLSIAILLIVLAFHIPGNPESTFTHHPLAEVVMNVLLIQNLPAQKLFADYSILGPMWSLTYEVQMYIFLPGIFVVLGYGRQTRLVRALALAAIAVSLARLDYLVPDHPVFQFFPCFLGGVLAWQIGKLATPIWAAWLWPVALLIFGIAFTVISDRKPGMSDYEYQWSVCLAIGMMIPFFRQIETRWLTRAGELIARYSYGIYLVHVPILWGVLHFKSALKWPLFLVGVALASVAVYHLIEKPMIDFGSRLTRAFPKLDSPAFVPSRTLSPAAIPEPDL